MGGDTRALTYVAERCRQAPSSLSCRPPASVATSLRCDSLVQLSLAGFRSAPTRMGSRVSRAAASQKCRPPSPSDERTQHQRQYLYGGTTSSTAACNNSLVFEDPGGDIAGSFSGSGTVAIGDLALPAPRRTTTERPFTPRAGLRDHQDGIASIFDGSSPNRKAEELFAHELGHTLGLVTPASPTH